MDTPALANDKYRATLRSTFIDGVDTTLNVTAIPTNVPTIIVVGWDTDFETVFRVEGTSGTNASNYALTSVSKIKGFSGNLPEGLAVNCLNNEEFFNQYASAIVASAGLKDIMFLDDTAASDTYAATLDLFPDTYDEVLGIPFVFKPNTSNTTAATLNVNAIAAADIRKYSAGSLVALETGDMIADNMYLLSWDGDRFILMNPSKVSDAQLGSGTADSTKFLRGDRTWQVVSASALSSKLITAVRSIASASGDVAYTGVGFIPTAILVLYSVDSIDSLGMGLVDSVKASGSLQQDNDGNAKGSATNFIDLTTAASAGQAAILKTFDADGFTLTWTKSGADTGNIKLVFLCFK